MILRPAAPGDAVALAALGQHSFCTAFAHLYAPEDLNPFLKQVYSPEAVAAEIADLAIIHRLAADSEDGPLTGFCKLHTPSWYADKCDAKNPIALGQLYTDPDRTGEGIGAALMDWAIAEARGRGHDAIQLSVWSENDGAQRFYRRCGFQHVCDIDFWVGNHRDHEYLWQLKL